MWNLTSFCYLFHLRELGENLSDQELRAMIEEFDQDGDGALNLEEFMALMTKEI
ncbi:Centrin-3 [Schistosoma japonicum]|nr:Centrin-3 [Schistosoma japonicum]